jgi:hypothetical protein
MFEDDELDNYNNYMDYVMNLLNKDRNLNPKVKKRMRQQKRLEIKDSSTWVFIYKKETFEFISYHQYKIMDDRDKKINKILNEK